MPSTGVYDSFRDDVSKKKIDLSADTFKILLVSGYTPNFGTHLVRSDVTGEVTGTGYTAGGATLTSVTLTKDTSGHKDVFTAANPTWATATISATGAVVYQSVGTAGTDRLLCYLDFGGTITSSAATFTVTIPGTGILVAN